MQTYSNDGVRQERTGWRDAALSARHKDWGFNCPILNIDFLAIEYDLGKPAALVEYKHYKAKLIKRNDPSYRAFIDVANGYRESGLPCFCARYWPEFWGFQIFPLNLNAKEYFAFGDLLAEKEYVTKLYQLRADRRKAENISNQPLRNELEKIRPNLFNQRPTIKDLANAIHK